MKNKERKIIIIVFAIIIAALLLKIFLDIKNRIVFNINTNNPVICIDESIKIDYELNIENVVKWESANSNIARVENDSVIGVGVGNTTIKGIVTKDNNVVEKSFMVSVYRGNKGAFLSDVNLPEGELFITKGDSYSLPLEYLPNDAYVDTINYLVSNDDVVSVDGKIHAKNIGSTNVSIIVNKMINKTIKVNVIERKVEPVFANKLTKIDILNDNIILGNGKSLKIEYTTYPENSFIENIEWSSSNDDIVTINDGMLYAKKMGDAVITLVINNITKKINVTVGVPVTELKLYSTSKIVMNVGQTDTIKPIILPIDATSKKLKYDNTNPKALSVDSNGLVKGVEPGEGVITITPEVGNVKLEIPYTINPKVGVINNTANVWGYTSPLDQIPERADKAFFQNLANSGQGVLKDNVYSYEKGGNKYSYDISNSRLSVNGYVSLVRIYYPKNVDLSMVNTFTFGNGTAPGAKGFIGLFSEADKDRSKIKSSGIIILVASKDGGYYRKEIYNATEFVKAIVNQKSGVKNAIGAYSGSGQEVGYATKDSPYDRLVIFNSFFWPNSTPNLKNKEIIVYSPVKEKENIENLTRQTLDSMIKNCFTNVTVISNNDTLINDYKNNFLIINPGSQMGTGHGYANIPPSNVFSYACR